MCRFSGETINHLLIDCDVAYGLWILVFRMFGILIQEHQSSCFPLAALEQDSNRQPILDLAVSAIYISSVAEFSCAVTYLSVI